MVRKRTTSITLSKDLYEKLDKFSDENELSRSEVIEGILQMIFNLDNIETAMKDKSPLIRIITSQALAGLVDLVNKLIIQGEEE